MGLQPSIGGVDDLRVSGVVEAVFGTLDEDELLRLLGSLVGIDAVFGQYDIVCSAVDEE